VHGPGSKPTQALKESDVRSIGRVRRLRVLRHVRHICTDCRTRSASSQMLLCSMTGRYGRFAIPPVSAVHSLHLQSVHFSRSARFIERRACLTHSTLPVSICPSRRLLPLALSSTPRLKACQPPKARAFRRSMQLPAICRDCTVPFRSPTLAITCERPEDLGRRRMKQTSLLVNISALSHASTTLWAIYTERSESDGIINRAVNLIVHATSFFAGK